MEGLLVIAEINRVDDCPPTPRKDPFFLRNLMQEIGKKHHITVEGMKSMRRYQSYFAARAEFCYRAYTESDANLTRIGRVLGDRDHTTVRNAIAVHCQRHGLPFPEGINWKYWLRFKSDRARDK